MHDLGAGTDGGTDIRVSEKCTICNVHFRHLGHLVRHSETKLCKTRSKQISKMGRRPHQTLKTRASLLVKEAKSRCDEMCTSYLSDADGDFNGQNDLSNSCLENLSHNHDKRTPSNTFELSDVPSSQIRTISGLLDTATGQTNEVNRFGASLAGDSVDSIASPQNATNLGVENHPNDLGEHFAKTVPSSLSRSVITNTNQTLDSHVDHCNRGTEQYLETILFQPQDPNPAMSSVESSFLTDRTIDAW